MSKYENYSHFIKKLVEYDVYDLTRKFKIQSSPDESVELYNSVINSPAGDIVEVGSASGGTTIILIKAAGNVGKIVYSIDPYPVELEGKATHYTTGGTQKLKNEFAKNILNGEYSNIIQYNKNTVDVIDILPKKLSIVFIDGLHEYSYVMDEMKLLYPLLVKDGWLYIHDTNWTIGQISNTRQGGLDNIWNNIDKKMFSEIKKVGSMFCGKK